MCWLLWRIHISNCSVRVSNVLANIGQFFWPILKENDVFNKLPSTNHCLSVCKINTRKDSEGKKQSLAYIYNSEGGTVLSTLAVQHRQKKPKHTSIAVGSTLSHFSLGFRAALVSWRLSPSIYIVKLFTIPFYFVPLQKTIQLII